MRVVSCRIELRAFFFACFAYKGRRGERVEERVMKWSRPCLLGPAKDPIYYRKWPSHLIACFVLNVTMGMHQWKGSKFRHLIIFPSVLLLVTWYLWDRGHWSNKVLIEDNYLYVTPTHKEWNLAEGHIFTVGPELFGWFLILLMGP